MASTSDIKNGLCIEYNGNLYFVTEFQHVKPGKGPAFVRNLGMRKSKNEYVAFLDSDDFWLPNKLEKQINFMRLNNYSFTFTDYFLIKKIKWQNII